MSDGVASDSGVEAAIRSHDQFEDTPEGWQKRWLTEIVSAKENQKKFWEDGRKTVNMFLARRDDGVHHASLLNLFTANIQTLQAMLYGKVPKVDVKRRWGDPDDVIGRTAGEIVQRLLNTDIERDSDTYTGSLLYVLNDRLLPGFGLAKVRYVADFTKNKVDPVYGQDENGEETDEIKVEGYEEEKKEHEDVVCDYVHWDDVLWSAGSKVFEEWRWVAFRCPMTMDELHARFDDILTKEKVESIGLNSKDNSKRTPEKLTGNDPWQRADVWEVWDKDNRKVWWIVEGFDVILDDKADPYELEGFWPFPRPLAANLTTDAYLPRADYIIAQDQYEEIHNLSSRIALLEKAVRMAGLYNGNSEEVRRLLSEAGLNELIGVTDWRTFSEGGGIKGNIEWFPLDMVSQAIQLLEQQRQAKIGLLYQVTGMSDIMRGQAQGQATATEQAIKAKFASVRVNHLQENFARFASDLQRLRMELALKLFDDQTIIDRSNIMFTAEQQNVQDALKLLRDEFVAYRIEVKPESISATDYASMAEERTQLLSAVSQFLTAMGPIGQADPDMIAPLLEMLKWMFVGFRGANTIEQVLDTAVVQAKKNAMQAKITKMQPPPPDPKVQAAQLDLQGKQMDLKIHQQKSGMDMQAHQQKVGMDMQEAKLDHGIKIAELNAEVKKKQIDTEMDVRKMESEMQRDAIRGAAGAPNEERP